MVTAFLPALLAVSFAPGACEVVVSTKAPDCAQFAAKEATNFLSRALGAPVPLSSSPTPGLVHLVLGGSEKETEGFERDEYVVESHGDTVRVYGRDSNVPFEKNVLGHGRLEASERGTVFGIYGFLEKYVGCRFYFPGELGECVPRLKSFDVPEGLSRSVPVFKVRNYSRDTDGIWFEGENRRACTRLKSLHFVRTSMQSRDIKCCHGLGRSHFVERFGKDHPEYFRLNNNGEREASLGTQVPNQLCFSSAVTNIIYADAREKLRKGLVADVMPQDCMLPCACEGCKAAYWKDAPEGNWANRQIWGMTVAVARRLKDEGVDGVVTQMAYHPYSLVPDIDIPDNVRVMVAVGGPWGSPKAQESQIAKLRHWREKIGPKIWTWNYMTKWSTFSMPGIPQMCPRAWGSWYERIGDLVFGAYANSTSDRWLYNYLNYYVFSRMCLDPKCDWRAVLDEHYRLMFGPAEAEMKQFFEELEDVWLGKVSGRVVTTPLGPMNVPPTDEDLWLKIYSKELRAKWRTLLRQAAAKTAPGSIEARRVALFTREYLDVLDESANGYLEKSSAVGAFIHRATQAHSLRLRPFKTHPKAVVPSADIRTEVRVWRGASSIFVVYDCEEPRMNDAISIKRVHDDLKIWHDDSIEMFLNPSADKRVMYQFIVSSRGDWFDCRMSKLGRGKSKEEVTWNSGAKVAVSKTGVGWRAEIEIPLSAFPEVKEVFYANFCRNRIVKDNAPAYSCYVWSPFIRQYDDLENFGSLDFRQVMENPQLIPEKDGNFDVRKNGRFFGKWASDGSSGVSLDYDNYLFPPASLKLVSTNSQSITFMLSNGESRLVPGRRYRLSFFMKGEGIQPLKAGNGAGVTVCDSRNVSFPPYRALYGTFDWQYHAYDFTADARTNVKCQSYARPRITLASGTAWFDGVRIEELSSEDGKEGK